MLNAISRRFDFNALLFKHAEDYIFYIHQFLQNKIVSDDATEFDRAKIIAEIANFELQNELLHRKMKKKITTSYIKFQFREDLMQKMHDQYEYLSFQSLANVLKSRA